MRRYLPVAALLLAWAATAHARGLLIPEDKTVPPLAMLNHKVTIAIEDQTAVTRVEQTFRNHTDRPLEATYVFPLPKGASLDHFSMWVDGKEVKAEIIEAAKAREVYTDIVRRTLDPGLLEYLGNDLAQLKAFPIPAHGDEKVAFSFQNIAANENGTVEYIYPLKTNGVAVATLEGFSITATIQSQHGVANVYSPTHGITLKRTNDREVTVNFDQNQAVFDKDFQLFYSTGDKDVGLTVLTHRPVAAEDGYFTMLLTPKVEIPKEYNVPRDMVLVLDTSGSMRGVKMEQARNALKYCLDHLGPKDRFALINFSTTVNRYRGMLLDSTPEQIGEAKKWVEKLQATGGTAIDAAMATALAYRDEDAGRSFNIVFFTDGQPTIGETDTDKILKNIAAKNTASTRIFTFGVGDDVNATFLDQIADNTRALTTYVRPAEDIADKVGRPVRQDQQPRPDQPEDYADQRRLLQRDIPHLAARPVPRRPAGADGPLQRQGSVHDQARRPDRHGEERIHLRRDVPGQDERRACASSSSCGRGGRSATCSTRSAPTARSRSWSAR